MKKCFTLLAALLCLPLLLTAVENDYMKDPKYLLGNYSAIAMLPLNSYIYL